MLTQPWIPMEVFARMVALRRALHQHPELSGAEAGSAERVVAALGQLGLPCQANVGGHGVVAEIPGILPGPAVALRADLDALPIGEETGLPFSSVHPGVMHACGHDGHSAMLLGAAELLLRGAPPPVPVRLIWQPAEERGTGALRVIAEGGLDGVAAIFGGHIDPRYPVGTLLVDEGAVNGSSDRFQVRVRGRGGHAARPHETVDAVLVASHIVVALQTVVSRWMDPAEAAVVTVGRLHAGIASNIIAETAQIEGTVRAMEPEARDRLMEMVPRLIRGVAETHGAEVEIVLSEGAPAVWNPPESTAVARTAAWDVVGVEGVGRLRTANLGSEDFAFYLKQIPGAFIRFGAGYPDRQPEPAHSPRFDLDERCLATGAAWMAAVARRMGERLMG